jgi:predicted outer membrane repeat protein
MNTKLSDIEILESRIAPSVFIVTTLADSGAGSLRDALAEADAHAGLDTIRFHLPAPPLHGANLIKLTGGALQSTGNVTITGPGASRLILDGNDASSVLRITDTDATTDAPTSISGLAFLHGNASTGGGIFSAESLTLKGVVISGNTASNVGGGLEVLGDLTAGAAPIKASITTSKITGNSTDGFGGGIALLNLSSITISKTQVTGNRAPNLGAGGVYAGISTTGGSLAITGCVISGNTGNTAGGLLLQNKNLNPTSKITISSTKVTGNTSLSTVEGGGGIYLGKGHAVISGSTIRNNTAVFNGGGIEAKGFASLTIFKSTISGNQTTTDVPYMGNYDVGGGGLCIKGTGASVAPVKIAGTRFIENSSKQDGGGVFAREGIALNISGATFSGNHAAGSGGGVFASGTGAGKVDLTVTGGTFVENVGGAGGGIAATGSGVISISAAKVTGNVGGFGGGIFVDSTGSVVIKNSVVSGNIGGIGGGLGIAGTADFKIIGGAIKDNSARGSGGGIETYGSTGSITGVIISGNTAAIGGGIFNSGNGTADIGVLTVQIAKVIANIAPDDPNVSGPADKFIFV